MLCPIIMPISAGKMITDGKNYLSCWMTMAQIKIQKFDQQET